MIGGICQKGGSSIARGEFRRLSLKAMRQLAVEQATNLRQHFPSLTIACFFRAGRRSDVSLRAKEQNIELLSAARSDRRLGATLARFFGRSIRKQAQLRKESTPCHRC